MWQQGLVGICKNHAVFALELAFGTAQPASCGAAASLGASRNLKWLCYLREKFRVERWFCPGDQRKIKEKSDVCFGLAVVSYHGQWVGRCALPRAESPQWRSPTSASSASGRGPCAEQASTYPRETELLAERQAASVGHLRAPGRLWGAPRPRPGPPRAASSSKP